MFKKVKCSSRKRKKMLLEKKTSMLIVKVYVTLCMLCKLDLGDLSRANRASLCLANVSLLDAWSYLTCHLGIAMFKKIMLWLRFAWLHKIGSNYSATVIYMSNIWLLIDSNWHAVLIWWGEYRISRIVWKGAYWIELHPFKATQSIVNRRSCDDHYPLVSDPPSNVYYMV